MVNESRVDVAVVGAGVVGAALALALARAGLAVALVDAREPEPFDPTGEWDLRVYALAPGPAAMLERLGAWPHAAAARAQPYRAMRVWEDAPAQGLAFDAAQVGEPQLGWIVEDRALRAALWQLLRNEPRVQHYCPARVTAFEAAAREAMLRLDDGGRVRARLAVAADGAWSPLRELAGIRTEGRDYAQRAVVAHVATARPHQDTAWQRFTTDGPLALLPLADGRSSVVWSLRDGRAAAVLALDDAAFCRELGVAFDGPFGAITSTSPRVAFPLRLQLAEAYAGPRLALVGDAAHVVHPLAGQGLNLGLLDAAALAQVLVAAHADAGDPGAATTLARYRRWRESDAALAAKSLDLLDALFRADTPGVGWLRRAGMAVLDHVAPLKRRIALQACGWAGRVPPLAQRLPAQRSMR
jgi:2-octaprenyl-3-methyl-6-methoxy-1,4-benzoquinol hydroxylase/2-octaprenylphenol hydroxylase